MGVTVQVTTSCQECEVQPQAKASLACGDKPDTPPPHTHTQRTRTSPHSLLPSSFKEFTLKQYVYTIYWDFALL